MPVEKAPMITLVTAYAVANVLERVTRQRVSGKDSVRKLDAENQTEQLAETIVQIKWPNDIVADGRKLCGILTEMSVEQGKIGYIVTGIGINVNMKDIPDDIKETASSLSLICGREIVIDELREQLCVELEKAYDKFFEAESLEPFWEDYNKKLVNCGKQVRVLDPAGDYEGISRGIDHEGNLIVEKTDGECVTVFSGEVSVRGIYGYV